MDYKIIPNFLPEKYFKYIFTTLLKDGLIPLFYRDTIASSSDTSGFFFSNLVSVENNIQCSNSYYKIILPLLHHINPKYVYRTQINCFIKNPNPIFSSPHIDRETPHNVCLYSINTNNGYTILDPKGQKIKVPSKANQALFFNGLIEHQAVTQTDENVRINVNINFQ